MGNDYMNKFKNLGYNFHKEVYVGEEIHSLPDDIWEASSKIRAKFNKLEDLS